MRWRREREGNGGKRGKSVRWMRDREGGKWRKEREECVMKEREGVCMAPGAASLPHKHTGEGDAGACLL